MKKALVAVTLALCCSIAFAAPVTVRMWTFLNPNGEKLTLRNLALRKIIDGFESQNKDVKISVEPQQWDIMTAKFYAAHAANNAPDIAWLLVDEFAEALKLGALTDLESLFVNRWSTADVEDVRDSTWDYGSQGGKHYAICLSRNLTPAIVYRKDLLQQNGISVPIKTWDDFIAAAQKLTGRDPKTGIQRWGFGQAFLTGKVDVPLYFSMMLSEQQDVFTNDGKANWSTAAGIKALRLSVDMIKKYKITPETSISISSEDLYSEFISGKYAMITGTAVRIPTLRQQASAFSGSDIDLMLLPGWDGKGHSLAGVSGWCVGVSSKSKVKQQAGAFLEFMSNRESDKLWLLEGGQIPIRKSTVSALPDFFGKPENKYISLAAEGIANFSWAPPKEFSISGYREALCLAVQDIITNNTPIETALQKGVAEFNRTRK